VLRQKFTLALIYPALITIIALGVITTLLVYVVPQIVAVYQQSRQDAPVSDTGADREQRFPRGDGMVLAGGDRAAGDRRDAAVTARAVEGSLAFAVVAPAGGRQESFPDWIRRASPAPCRSSPAAARRSCAHSTPPPAWCGLVRCAAPPMRWPLTCARLCRWRARLPVSGCFRPCSFTWSRMASKAGSCLPCSTAQRAEQEQDVERRLTWLTALVQPLLIVFMGAIVLVLVLAVMLPIVSMNQLIR
jgi:general secretion pathway protein F